MSQIAPSILAADFNCLGEQICELEENDVKILHVDVMDGMFVPSISFGMPVLASIHDVTDQVMDAARGAGAAGGTSLHAKGTGTELARKFLGVSIAAEKELVLIVTREETRKPIMKAIMEQAGSRTKAQSLVFSLPVDEIAGLRELQ